MFNTIVAYQDHLNRFSRSMIGNFIDQRHLLVSKNTKKTKRSKYFLFDLESLHIIEIINNNFRFFIQWILLGILINPTIILILLLLLRTLLHLIPTLPRTLLLLNILIIFLELLPQNLLLSSSLPLWSISFQFICLFMFVLHSLVFI